MASKKELEVIALLSMYGDKDDDMEEAVDNNHDNKTDDSAILTENKEESEVGANGTVNITGYICGSSIGPVVANEPEEGETATTGTVQLLTTSRQSTSPQSEGMNYNITEDGQKEINPLNMFLPPPPTTNCFNELQERIIEFRSLTKKTGRSFNSEVRNRKEYHDPDFLTHAVTF